MGISKYYAKWHKSDTKDHVLYVHFYEILENLNLSCSSINQWLPGAKGSGRQLTAKGNDRPFRGYVNALDHYYSNDHMLCTCQNSSKL